MATLELAPQSLLIDPQKTGASAFRSGFWLAVRRSGMQWVLGVSGALLLDVAVISATRLSHVGQIGFRGHAVIGALLLVLLVMMAVFDALLKSVAVFSAPRGTIAFCGFIFICLLSLVLSAFDHAAAETSLVFLHGSMLFGGYELFSTLSKCNRRKRVAIIGIDSVASRIADYLQQHPELRFEVLGLIDRRNASRSGNGGSLIDRRNAEHTLDHNSAPEPRYPTLGSLSEFKDICRKNFLDEVFVTLSSKREMLMEVIELGHQHHVAVRLVPDQLQEFSPVAEASFVGEFPTLALNQRKENAGALFLKRAVDVLVSATGLILLAPIVLVISVLIKADSRGPVFYRSERIGRKGRSFQCLKFRTMTADADCRKHELAHLNQRNGILFKIDNDPRITPAGRFLRKYSIDELPQLVNVLLGDMSLVGPRPSLPSEVNRYDVEALRRLEAIPGITGLWQVNARRDPSFHTYLSMDLAYIDNWNLWLDLTILAQTVRVVLAGTGQ